MLPLSKEMLQRQCLQTKGARSNVYDCSKEVKIYRSRGAIRTLSNIYDGYLLAKISIFLKNSIIHVR